MRFLILYFYKEFVKEISKISNFLSFFSLRHQTRRFHQRKCYWTHTQSLWLMLTKRSSAKQFTRVCMPSSGEIIWKPRLPCYFTVPSWMISLPGIFQ